MKQTSKEEAEWLKKAYNPEKIERNLQGLYRVLWIGCALIVANILSACIGHPIAGVGGLLAIVLTMIGILLGIRNAKRLLAKARKEAEPDSKNE